MQKNIDKLIASASEAKDPEKAQGYASAALTLSHIKMINAEINLMSTKSPINEEPTGPVVQKTEDGIRSRKLISVHAEDNVYMEVIDTREGGIRIFRISESEGQMLTNFDTLDDVVDYWRTIENLEPIMKFQL